MKVRTLRIWPMLAFMLTVALAAESQTYTDIFNFDGTHGAAPSYPQLLAQGRDGNLYGTAPSGGRFNGGVVFRLTLAGVARIMTDMTNPDGDVPYSGLTLGTDGDFYGAAFSGGKASDGTIFKITSSGMLTDLYNFTDADARPQAPPIQAVDGYLYGTSSRTMYRITTAGAYAALGTLPGASYGALVQATDGSFYGTTYDGGTSDDGTVFKARTDGTVTTVVNFDFTHGSQPYSSLIQGTDGNFYGTTKEGGSNKQGVAFRLTPQGVLTVLHNFPDGNYPGDGATPTSGLIQGSDGNLYGVAALSSTGSSCGMIFEITAVGGYSILYSFGCADGGDPLSTPMQHTNGTIYGLADGGGPDGDGVLYSFDLGLSPFAKLLPVAGRSGSVIGILGQGFTGTTSVSFNGTAAAFKIISDTFLEATVPAGAATGAVTVSTGGGILISNQQFRVIQ